MSFLKSILPKIEVNYSAFEIQEMLYLSLMLFYPILATGEDFSTIVRIFYKPCKTEHNSRLTKAEIFTGLILCEQSLYSGCKWQVQMLQKMHFGSFCQMTHPDQDEPKPNWM